LRFGLPLVVTVGGSLALVLGVFFLIAWAVRRAAPHGLTVLPSEVVEVLGRAPLAGRQQLHLLRCGKKLILVSVTPAGAETLTEITDPEEVDRLAGLCQQARPNSATAAFRQVLRQLAGQNKVAGETPGSGLDSTAMAAGRQEDADG
jgi:flagellar biogenesis protein FliO